MILIGLPHSEISGSTFATNYPELFAGDRVLHRHSAPRHPPCALCSLTYKPASSPVIDRTDAIDMNGDRYVSSFRRNSQFLSCLLQLLRCTTRSGARTKTGRAWAGTRGFGWTIFAMAAHRGDPALGLLMVRRSRRSRKGTAAAAGRSARWSRGDSNS